MTQPRVDQNELDGALGVLPLSAGRLHVVAGVSSQGPFETPSTFGDPKDLRAMYGDGPAVEALAHYMEKYGRAGAFIRTHQSIDGDYLDAVVGADGSIGSITKTGTGTCTFSDNSSDPLVEADVVILFNVGGTRGTAGIVYQISLDNGNTWGPPQALGTATHIDVGTTGASIAISAGTIVAGDFISFHLTAPIEASAGELVTSGLQNPPTLHAGTHPWDDYEVKILFVDGGTRGIAGITYKWSLDGGRTYSPTTALGTATYIIVPESGGVRIDLGAGTIDDGATIEFPTVAPQWSTDELGAAIDALKLSTIAWELLHIVGPMDPDAEDLADLKISGMAAAGDPTHAWIGSARLPVGDESEPTYLASLAAAFDAHSSKWGSLCAGACEFVSSVSGRKYRRPFAFIAAAREAASSEEVNNANTKLGPLPCSIRDEAGNPKHHDESAHPGLDDARFYVARTVKNRTGVYVNRPLLHSPEGSDFALLPHRRVMNIARAITLDYETDLLNADIIVDKTTGFILEREARDIEANVTARLEAALLGKPKASGVTFVVNRTDNLLSTKKIRTRLRVVPLAYVETIEEEVAFENPALRIVAR